MGWSIGGSPWLTVWQVRARIGTRWPTIWPRSVLAAGAGQRLRPISSARPKPLCPVGGIALVDLALARVLAVTGAVAVNLHDRAEQIAAHLDARSEAPGPHLSFEAPEALGTAGRDRRAAAVDRRAAGARAQRRRLDDRRAGRVRRGLGRQAGAGAARGAVHRGRQRAARARHVRSVGGAGGHAAAVVGGRAARAGAVRPVRHHAGAGVGGRDASTPSRSTRRSSTAAHRRTTSLPTWPRPRWRVGRSSIRRPG